ncbi:alkaline phosphatase [Alteromonas aestuariivivens]|uniref:Alkaline phosphatase n=1 Tax=Alteromonas aestuariivivens TaxID=1938339 RepID=A0A3D8MEB9_9ALTE|nr:alkaline phosphatase [Alteromonas aestuariivivens]RDV29219.1 alkaline phosphatase [Alteromonas aestuariivivens]
MKLRITLSALIGAALIQGCVSPEVASTGQPEQPQKPKNIIMVVADGMGPAYTTAYRNYMDDPGTEQVELVVLDRMLVGNASTYPANVSGYVTDSAAAATALASGVKSYNGAIGVDENKVAVESVLQRAKALGMRTGVAVTSQINHATPAAYLAHNESRKNYNEIADSYYDDKVNGEFVADVMLGGGTSYFEREDRDIVAQFIDAGYEYVDTYNKLATLPAGSKVLGLFAPVGLPPVLDDSRKNRLAYLTEHAIRHLENERGFFLLVEASQVDWAGHDNDIGSAMAEMHDLALAMEYLKDYVSQNPDTLVLLTADHSTGGLTVGANGVYEWRPQYLRGLKGSAVAIATELVNQSQPAVYLANQLGFELTDEERQLSVELAAQKDVKAAHKAIKTLLDTRTNTGWTTGGHTGVDVEVFAVGAGSSQFAGQLDNTDIAKRIFTLLQGASPGALSEPVNGSRDCDFKSDWHCQ